MAPRRFAALAAVGATLLAFAPTRARSAVEQTLRPRALVGTFVLTALVLAVGIAIGPLADVWSNATAASPRLPDALLAVRQPTTPPFTPARQELLLLRPEANGDRPLLEGAGEPLVAPDGQALYVVQHLEVGDQLRTAVVALGSHTLDRLWSADVAARPLDEAAAAPHALHVELAAGADRVYVATHRWQSPDPIEVIALDRADGAERRRWQVGFPGPAGGLRLFAGPRPEGTRAWIDLLAVLPGPSGQTNPPPAELHHVRLALRDGMADVRHEPTVAAGLTDLAWRGRMLADGRGLFATTCAERCTRREVLFFDLATGSIDRLDLPFHNPAYLTTQEGLSHDGRRLYVLDPAAGEIAVVDLFDRRIEQTALVLDGAAAAAPPLLAQTLAGLRGLLVGPASAKMPFTGELQLSPDGRRLFAIGVDGTDRERTDGVWVIDTAAWRLTERWLTGTRPTRLLLSGDGDRLYVQTSSAGGTTNRLRALDAATGTESAAVDVPSTQFFSIAELYRDAYGRSPIATGAVAPGQPPLAAMVVAAGPNTLVGGDEVDVELRFVDPGGGQTLEPGRPNVRYEPPRRVVATLETRPGGDRLSLELSPAGHAIYRGRVSLPSPTGYGEGAWSARVVAEWPDGLRRRAGIDDAVVVQRPLEATDGRRYVLTVSTGPARPIVDQPLRVSAAFVDAETRAPLPAGVTPLIGLPTEVEASFFGGGATTVHLTPVGHGVYAGEHRGLWSSGAWRVWAALKWPDRPHVHHVVGSVQVGR